MDYDQDIEFGERRDYSKRNRKLEWRHNWFHLHRSYDDNELRIFLDNALDLKRKKIERQKQEATHQAAYSPAGAGTPWFSIGPRNVNGRVKSIAVHPTNENIVYAGAASGGVWKSEDGGQSWRPLWDMQESLAIGSIAIAPSAPSTIYVGTGEWTPPTWDPSFPGAGVYVSNDSGATWNRRPNVLARRIARILVSPTNPMRLYVAGESGFERSTDGGMNWTTIKTGQISDGVIDPNNADILYINVVNDGIYKSTNGGDNWTKLATGPTGTNASWVKLAIGTRGTNRSNFLVAKNEGTIYKSTNGGTSWTTVSGSHGLGYTGWCDMIAVAPDNEDIILAGGVELERTTNGGTSWSTPVDLHADQQMAMFALSNTDIVYECNDGGVYRSEDKGATWKKASHGMVITQFYDVGSWDTISTVAGGGTQDQGTNMTTGGLTWHNIFGWDGGYFVVHPSDPRTIYAEHQNSDIHKSIDGGNTWTQKTAGLSDGTPWTGVITMDLRNPNTLFVGTTRIFRTTDGCATPWAISSQVLGETVSCIAISPSDSNRVYAGTGESIAFGTGNGRIYRSDDGGATSPWADKTTATLPSSRPIMDIAVDYTDANRLVICYGGTNPSGTPKHVFVSANGGNSWSDISGNLPNLSVNAIALDPNNVNTIYVGTDTGVYRTTDLGVNWQAFDNGIPNVIVSDLHVDRHDNLLYAVTFGRGMYKLNIAPASSEPAVDLYLRDSILDTGERFPSPSGQPNPNDVSDQVYWWESPDIKVDVSPYYSPDAVFDGVEFDEDLTHEDPKRTETNRFYLAVHNRGWRAATNVRVRAFFADAHAGLPPLPNALIPPDFNLTSTAVWQPIGSAQPIPRLEPNRPVIVSWNWTIPASANTHSCLLAVVSSGDDPITTVETNVNNLIKSEKRVCLKNLHVVNSLGPRPAQTLVSIKFHNAKKIEDLVDIIVDPVDFTEGTIGMLLEPIVFSNRNEALHGVHLYPIKEGEDVGEWYVRPGTKLEIDRNNQWQTIDRSQVYEFDASKNSEIRGIKIKPNQTIHAVVTFKGSHNVPYGRTQKFAIMQRQDGEIVGGSTYEVRLRRAAALLPVSRIRIVLEKVRILVDKDPWIKGRRKFHFMACVSFNNDPCRRHWSRVPQKEHYKISDWPRSKKRKIDLCVFDGYVAEKDNMLISILPGKEEWLDPEDKLSLYIRRFNGPPETWVGSYSSSNHKQGYTNGKKISYWQLWYRIESVRI
jgi:photosystem II stability/assembly factor-like uncharacterized protein